MNVKQANAKFRSMTAAQRRVAIAKDVLKQLRLRRFTAMSGTYVEFGKNVLANHLPTTQVCDITKGQKCGVCARGAMFVAAVERFDNLRVNQLGNSYGYYSIFSLGPSLWNTYEFRFFTRKQIVMIETAFEQSEIHNIVSVSDSVMEKCKNFAPTIRSAKGRMVAIMKNIVRNKGTFRP